MKIMMISVNTALMIADLVNLFFSLKYLNRQDKIFITIVTGITMGLLIMSMVLITRW